MSVRLVTPDAQRLFAQKIAEHSEVIDRWKPKLRALRAAHPYAPAAMFSDVALQIEGLEQARAGLQSFLGEHDAWSKSQETPLSVGLQGAGAQKTFGRKIIGDVFLYQNAFYEVVGQYSKEESIALVTDFVSRRRKRAEYLVGKSESDSPGDFDRRPIPENVRHEVWRRDQARCVKCGSSRNLEFDHIIPVSKGGSSTARNIQLLCEDCNRAKSDDI